MTYDRAYEKLGLLYLGRETPLDSEPGAAQPLLYKSKYLTTHGALIGMTGSGKTGLGIALIEEAIMDDLPSIIIDPKGDMANLLLSFPGLGAEDFREWVDPVEASRKGLSVEQSAEATAQQWRDGLASWGQGSERIEALRKKSEMTVYTPGSNSGVPVSIMAGFAAPPQEISADLDAFHDLVGSTATSLLTLIGIDSDPLTGREHVLISTILTHYWGNGEDLSIESLIGAVVNPPFEKVGVFGLAVFFPQAERMKLALQINNVIASPTFAAWLRGQPLDIGHLLYGDDGRPRTAIFYLAHLSEPERMFFVTLLLNALIGWMRRQQGASSLKALLYMDEIFGYFPPVADPPSKKPMLLLLKQARAYGIGVVLSTQNPVDLDYKGLSNIGTWFVGRLQTTQDQNRVLDGIVGAGGETYDRAKMRRLVAELKGRQFLLTSAHLEKPILFETRWVMSYLKGPMSLKDISMLMATHLQELEEEAARLETAPAATSPTDRMQDGPPLLSEKIAQRFYLSSIPTELMICEPWLAATASVRFYDRGRNIDEVHLRSQRLYLDDAFREPDWSEAQALEIDIDRCPDTPPSRCSYLCLPEFLSGMADFSGLEKAYGNYLYQNERLELWRAPSLQLESRPGESKAQFSVRIADCLRERKEAAIEKTLQAMHATRTRLEGRLEAATARIDKEKSDVSATTADTVISFGTAILGAFLGRRAASSTTMTRTATTIRKAGRISKEKEDVKRAEKAAARLTAALQQLEDEQAQAMARIVEQHDPASVETEVYAVKPRRSDIFDVRLYLLWEMKAPHPPGP